MNWCPGWLEVPCVLVSSSIWGSPQLYTDGSRGLQVLQNIANGGGDPCFPDQYKNLDSSTKNKAKQTLEDYWYGNGDAQNNAVKLVNGTGYAFNHVTKALDGNDAHWYAQAWQSATEYAVDRLGGTANSNPSPGDQTRHGPPLTATDDAMKKALGDNPTPDNDQMQHSKNR